MLSLLHAVFCMSAAFEYVHEGFPGGYNRGMEEYFDEIILLVACAAVSLCFADANHVVIGILLSVSLVCICDMVGLRWRIIAQLAFLICAFAFPAVLPFLPVCAYVMLHERMWLLRVVWVVPLVVALSFGGCAAVEGAVIAIACAAAVLMGVKDARMRAERMGMRFAFDDLRERNLGLLSERELDTRTQGIQGASGMQAQDAQARTAGPFCNLTEREYAVAKLVAEGMDNRDIAASLFLSEGTVRNHISSILGKLELSNRTQIAIMYYKG